MNPVISVLMSVFNGEGYLAQAVDSILAQSEQAFEFIIVDDASTDNSRTILNSYLDSRIKVLTLDRNGGLVNALNLALANAKGRYLARMDADDVSYPDRFRHQLSRFESEPTLALLGTAFDYLNDGGRKFGSGRVRVGNDLLQSKLVREGNQFCHSSIMMRADLVRKVGGYRDLAGRYAQDYDLWLRLSERGSIDNLVDAFLGYRCHPEMLSITKLPLQRRAAEIYKLLAYQRRSGRQEDISAAELALSSDAAALADVLAKDYLGWSDLYSQMGEPKMARQMVWKAVRVAPMGKSVRQRLAQAVRWRLNKVRG